MIRVFITYAWEHGSDELKSSVWQLAGWIERSRPGDVKVITDHLFAYRPPEKGWSIWMQDELDQADVVLVVCTQSYHDRFMKRDGIVGGAGVTFEGVVITQDLLEGIGRNKKYFPIMPDGGKLDHVPKILKPYHNGHSFPSKQEGIAKLIFNENPHHDSVNAVLIEESVKLEIEIVNKLAEVDLKLAYSIVVRSFLSLADIDKIKVCKNLGIVSPQILSLTNAERDREIFRVIKERDLLRQLWNEINEIQAFENNTNPFIK